MTLTPPPLVLGSASPRRLELLSTILPSFEVDTCDIDEEAHFHRPFGRGAESVAAAKALEVARRHPGSAVLGADTIVVVEELVLNKPATETHARQMMQALSGRTHQVITGVALAYADNLWTEHEATEVTFAPLREAEVEAYVRSGEPFDKAGGYGIQGKGSVFIRRINGCYFNVVGLPLYRVSRMLERVGIHAWQHW